MGRARPARFAGGTGTINQCRTRLASHRVLIPAGASAGVVLSSRFLPGVTARTVGLAALAGLPLARGVLVTTAVLTGQLSIGWSNDYPDVERDRAVRRSDKPVASGAVAPGVAGTAAGVSLILTLALPASLGWRGGVAALVGVVSAWLYNLGTKATILSWLA